MNSLAADAYHERALLTAAQGRLGATSFFSHNSGAAMEKKRTGLAGLILRYVSGLRFPWLLAVVAALFAIDLVIPDFVPFVDEL